jgi:hypothetical protein
MKVANMVKDSLVTILALPTAPFEWEGYMIPFHHELAIAQWPDGTKKLLCFDRPYPERYFDSVKFYI